MRVRSGDITKYLYFVAVDSADFVTRETGLSSFTAYRSRNGGAAAAMTTPTVNEVDSTNMPGVYELLIDEDTTIDSGDDEQEMVFHITATGMAPVTRTIELYRPKITAGETLTVASGNANAAVQSIAANAITAAAIATAAIDADAIADNAIDAGAIADGAITAAKIATGAIDADALAADAAAEIADAVWDEDATAHQTQGTFGQAIGDPAADANTIYGAVVTGAAGATIAADIIAVKAETAAILADTAEIGAAGAGLTAIPWNAAWDAEVQSEVQDAIEANHLDHLLAADYDPAAKPGTATALLNELVESDAGVSRFTANALEQAPSGGATAADIADAVWDEAQAGHVAAGSFGEIAAEIAAILVDTGTTLDGKLDTIDANVDAILLDTAEIGAAGAGLSAIPWNAAWDAEVQSEAADALVAYDPPTKAELDAAVLNVSVDEIQASALADLFNTDSATTYAAAVAGSPVKEIADNAGGSALTAAAIADAVHDEVIDGSLTFRQSMRLQNSALFGKLSGAATTSITFRDVADSKDRITAVVTQDGNRTAVTLDDS